MLVFEGRWGNLLVPAACSAAVVPLTSFCLFVCLSHMIPKADKKRWKKIESISGLDNVNYDFNSLMIPSIFMSNADIAFFMLSNY